MAIKGTHSRHILRPQRTTKPPFSSPNPSDFRVWASKHSNSGSMSLCARETRAYTRHPTYTQKKKKKHRLIEYVRVQRTCLEIRFVALRGTFKCQGVKGSIVGRPNINTVSFSQPLRNHPYDRLLRCRNVLQGLGSAFPFC